MKPTIYEQHDKAFQYIRAYVLFDDLLKKPIGSVAFKWPKDGMGKLYCYLHLHGDKMVRGFASECGYDKESKAFFNALANLKLIEPKNKDAYSNFLKTMTNEWKEHLYNNKISRFLAV